MHPFCKFMASKNGRIIRVVAGIILIVVGIFVPDSTIGAILIVVGLVPALAGAFDYCVFAPLFGCPMKGSTIRAGK